MSKTTNHTFPVVVLTKNRDVWFGFAAAIDVETLPDRVVLERLRHVFSWDAKTVGVGGLAANGPAPGSKIGPEIARGGIREVAAILVVNPEALPVWEKAGW